MLIRILANAFRLRCPRCKAGALFQTRFKMFLHCPTCELKYEREQGYFIGAMYLNYGATVFVAFPGYFAFEALTLLPFFLNFGIWSVVSGIFPIFFYRYSKSLWLNFDYLLNPSCE